MDFHPHSVLFVVVVVVVVGVVVVSNNPQLGSSKLNTVCPGVL